MEEKNYFKKINEYYVKDEEARDSISAIEETIGDNDSGLIKAVNDLETTVGDSESGLVKEVSDIETTIGDNESGLVKDIADLSSALDETTAYSSTEELIGTWIDGKPLYRKVIDLGDLSDTSRYTDEGNGIKELDISTGLTLNEIDKVVLFQTYGVYSTWNDLTNTGNYDLTSLDNFSWYDDDTTTRYFVGTSWFKSTSLNDTGFSIICYNKICPLFNGGYAVIEYTKASDEA